MSVEKSPLKGLSWMSFITFDSSFCQRFDLGAVLFRMCQIIFERFGYRSRDGRNVGAFWAIAVLVGRIRNGVIGAVRCFVRELPFGDDRRLVINRLYGAVLFYRCSIAGFEAADKKLIKRALQMF